MTAYLKYKFEDSPEFISTFDELPLWSAPFGLLLLKHVELKPHLTVLDIGSGAGFPLLELAQRLGDSCKCYGLDPWKNANERARIKIKNYNVTNVEVLEGSASQIPFDDNKIDLIVSNLGINNFDEPSKVFAECNRVLKAGGKIALTSNLFGHWRTFYKIFEETIIQLGKEPLLKKLNHDEEHRGTVSTISKLFIDSGLKINRHFEETFEMRFLDGTAFLNHSFIKLGWLSSWLGILPENEHEEVFGRLEENLNAFASNNNGLTLSVPMTYIEGLKM